MSGDGPSELRVGAGKATIVYPDSAWPVDGYGGQRDPLEVRTLLIELDGEGFVLVVLDQTSLAPEPLERMRRIVAQGCAVDADRLLVGVSHTFSAPHLAPLHGVDNRADERMARARDAVFTAAAESARDARAHLRPATVTTAVGQCHVNVNRDVEMLDGWGLGHDENGFSDKTLTTVRFTDPDGIDIAILANYAVQPSVMAGSLTGDGTFVVSADLAGEAMRHVEGVLPGAVALFLIGAAGDQAPLLPEPALSAEIACDTLGRRLGAEVVSISRNSSRASSTPLRLVARSLTLPGQQSVDRLAFRPTRSHRFEAGPRRELPFWILILGEIAIAAVQVELSAGFGARLRAASPFPTTLVMTMVNGGDKYLPDAPAFDRMTYEALSSRYACGGAEVLESALLDELRELAALQN